MRGLIRVGAWLVAVQLALGLGPALAHAEEGPIHGFGPDFQVTGGVGFGLGDELDNAFLGRIRLGVLYAFEPYWVDAGLTLELGALAELAIGGELEWNEFNGWFANLGLQYARHERLTGHLSIGYMIFGIEWQHAFDSPKPHDALLFVARFPLGFWWFSSGHEQRPFAPTPSTPPPTAAGSAPLGPRPLGPTQPSAAGSEPASPAAPAPDVEARRRAAAALAEAALAEARADPSATAEALRRAHTDDPDPLLWLRIADADLARGKPALAAEDLQQFLAVASSPEALARKPSVETRLRELLLQLARLRLTLEAASGEEQVVLDGVPQPGAALGYDVLIEPGSHVLQVMRSGKIAAEHRFDAKAGEVVRLSLPLSAAGGGDQPR